MSDVLRYLRQRRERHLSAAVVQRLQWFAYALQHDNNVSRTCRHFAISRSTFLCWARRFNPQDIQSLEDHSRRPHTVNTAKTDQHAVELIGALRTEHPFINKFAIQKILSEQHGIYLSSSTIGREISRHTFFFGDSPSHRAKRAAAKRAEKTVQQFESEDITKNTHSSFMLNPYSQLAS